MLLKCCTQYVSKFGKLSSGHRTGKGQFSFQSQRSTMPKNVQTNVELCSFHMLVRLCSKSFKLDFNSMWPKKFQMYKLGLEKAKEPGIKLPTFVQKNIYFCFNDYTNAFDCVDHNKLWKILKEMGICLLRNLYAGQEATVGTGHGTTDWFKIGKEVWQGCILALCLFNFRAEYLMQNARLDKSQARIKIGGRNGNNLRYADDTSLTAESQ